MSVLNIYVGVAAKYMYHFTLFYCLCCSIIQVQNTIFNIHTYKWTKWLVWTHQPVVFWRHVNNDQFAAPAPLKKKNKKQKTTTKKNKKTTSQYILWYVLCNAKTYLTSYLKVIILIMIMERVLMFANYISDISRY